MNRRKSMERLAAGVTAATVFALGGCGVRGAERGGEILAGYPTTVVNKWYTEHHTTKSGPDGYIMYLRTEDCPPGVDPTPGLDAITPGCVEKDHEVKITDYMNFHDGDGIVWTGVAGNSRVEQHRYGRGYYYVDNYTLDLEVKQCLDEAVDNHPAGCTTGRVSTTLDTWMNFNNGDVITFDGEKGKVLS